MEADTEDDPPPNFRTTVVKTGLARFCRSSALVTEIDAAVKTATRIAFEGSKLLNLFFLHLLQHDLPIPKLNPNWIYTNVYQSVSVDRTQSQPRSSPCEQLEQVRQQLYLTVRPVGLQWPHRDLLGQVLKQLSKDTYVNCKNHVAVNFQKRLRRWWFSKLTRKLQTPLSRKDRWRLADTLVKAACKDNTGFGMPRGMQLTSQDISYLRNKLTELGGEGVQDEDRCPVEPNNVTDKKLSAHVSTLVLFSLLLSLLLNASRMFLVCSGNPICRGCTACS